ncbi:dihydrofolate reductase family protein [Jiangella mangrovi]|uniref:Dihydrofolate reductase n=1 Tax=Jiangella mangrovi TaxID=1524084 RepID=A0A7W9GPW3_9ACTN|nr:dihydrofolate reductase family protein [Jiangella mangrovi]MBB5787845.1 dihydrofolate reductase [Jiangella mangrovi]
MGRVLWHVTMSVDGFIAGPDHDMDWVFERPAAPEASTDVVPRVGAILCGRHTYDVGQRDVGKGSGEAFEGEWSGPEFVLTTHPPAEADSGAAGSAGSAGSAGARTFLSGDIGAAVSTAMAAAGDGDLLVLGADVALQCLEAGLVDELLVDLAPLLLGDGVRLYGGPGRERVDLELVEATGTVLRYRVLKA